MQELLQIINLSDRDCKTNMFKWLMTQISVPEVLYIQPYTKIVYWNEKFLILDTDEERKS